MLYQCIFKNDDCNYHAFVNADNLEQLFWRIDEYGDPYGCEIYAINNISFCFKSQNFDGDFIFSKFEIGEMMCFDIESPKGKPKRFVKDKKGNLKLE